MTAPYEDAEYWALQAGNLRQERDEARSDVERLRAAATAYLLEQTQENAKALAEVVGWVPRRDEQSRPSEVKRKLWDALPPGLFSANEIDRMATALEQS